MWLWTRYLLSFTLLPLVLFLGSRVRKNILRMPEASGARKGAIGVAPHKFSIVSLGESPIAGVGLSTQMDNLAPHLAQSLHESHQQSVCWSILGKSGIKVAELLQRFEVQLPERTDLMFIAIGVNDCKEGTTMRSWEHKCRELHTHLRQKYPEAFIIFSSVPPLSCFPSLPYPIRLFLGFRSDVMNAILRKMIAELDHNTLYLPLPNILSKEYFAKDGFHPNAKAHKAWAQAISESFTHHNTGINS